MKTVLDRKPLKSFAVELGELHCTIHFLMITSKTHKLQVQKAMSDLKKQKFVVDDKLQTLISDVFMDCTNNPGFTFELGTTDVAVCIRQDICCRDSNYFVGLLAHEITHSIFFVFRSLGIMTEDDEHIAIVLLNVLEQALDTLGIRITYTKDEK